MGLVCRIKYLNIFLLGEEEEAKEEGNQGGEVKGLEGSTTQLNMSSVTGVTSKRSMKLWGTILREKR